MIVSDAQREVRTVFLGGFPGQFVSGVVWLLSAGFATWGSRTQAILVLILGGSFIFPAAMLLLRIMGRRTSLGSANPLGGLAMQVAFTIPASYPIVWMAVQHRPEWFYPAFMVVVGAHYLPFVFLYGMPHFAVLAVLMVAGAVGIVLKGPADFAFGGWVTGLGLLAFAFLGLALAGREGGAAARSA